MCWSCVLVCSLLTLTHLTTVSSSTGGAKAACGTAAGKASAALEKTDICAVLLLISGTEEFQRWYMLDEGSPRVSLSCTSLPGGKQEQQKSRRIVEYCSSVYYSNAYHISIHISVYTHNGVTLLKFVVVGHNMREPFCSFKAHLPVSRVYGDANLRGETGWLNQFNVKLS